MVDHGVFKVNRAKLAQFQRLTVTGMMAAAVLLPVGWTQELPDVVPDCPSHVQQTEKPRAELAVTQEQRPSGNPFSSSTLDWAVPEQGRPLSNSDRFNLFLYRTGSKANLSSIALHTTAGFQEHPYGPGLAGYSKLYGSKLADSASRNFFHTVVLSAAFGQDPRYYRSTADSTMGRFADAATGVVITRTNDGRKTFNSSRVLATFLSSALSNAYYPEAERTFGNTMGRAGRRLMMDMSNGVVREFAPDLLRKLFGRKKAEPVRATAE